MAKTLPRLAGAAFVALAAVPFPLAAPVAAQTASFTPKDETPDMFPNHAGRDETVGLCSACHNFRLVAAQGQTREQWEDTLNVMTLRHNMPALEGEERRRVLDYLETAFPPRATGRTGGWKNPFAPQ
ncbi:hypothetical protein QNA08_15870 [Chelatococcus sp. SYSU_G07232]|uniref:Sulfite dehydrogenase (Cytochrome) subunit SorB n=1 Tax=Chelatococcus albus TaxID=3047466 RepID=A0ABT7AK03_9HYPH|nr:hypothetical protein [Chelatococcus sp. SYSU_G07232]MDJ1159702.1 hypothetical protein [Chelatococcus sp. SYSU_G07232]